MSKVYKFYSPVCGPCKVLERNLQESKISYESIDITNPTEEQEDLMLQCKVRNIPMLVKVDDTNNIIKSHVGILSVNQIVEQYS